MPPSTSPTVDGKYYEAAPPRSLGERLAIAARERIYQEFLTRCAPRPGEPILDVGVSDVVTDAANVLERRHPRPEDIVAVGLGEGGAFRRAFPAVRYARIAPAERLPFADGTFRYATSNAVLEHVGDPEAQRRFVAELLRVAAEVFITVPNRFFPFEHHTAIPFAHYWDPSFRLACRLLHKEEWARPENLILMSRASLAALAPPEAAAAELGYTGLRLGPFSSNLFLRAARQPCRPAAPRPPAGLRRARRWPPGPAPRRLGWPMPGAAPPPGAPRG